MADKYGVVFLQLLISLLVCYGAVADGHIIGKRQECINRIGNCANYGVAACRQYHAWAQHNCELFCGFCSGGQAGTSNGCVDVISNCAALGPNICKNYVEFVHINCQKTCNLCGAFTECFDKETNCASYGSSACKAPYEAWAKEHCNRTCNMCIAPGGSGQTHITSHSEGCYYKTHMYQEGQSWTDGCDKNCTCIDGKTGNYLCQSLCPVYQNLPSGCQMVTEPGQCCAKPHCPQQQGCLYKGHTYSQGQQWNDACTLKCTCKNAATGYYECHDLCVTWNLLPMCHLDNPAPGKCCSTPNCPSNIPIQYPPDYVPE